VHTAYPSPLIGIAKISDLNLLFSAEGLKLSLWLAINSSRSC
jgi:hypothetical protein